MSGGMQRRLSIAAGLVIEPDILFLDEPFTFLDENWQMIVARQLKNENLKSNTTMLLASHQLKPVKEMGAKIVCVTNFPMTFNHKTSKSYYR